ncbi:glutamyl/tRNA (Gln) amidotransferase subunit C [Legionella quinlivanii]|uniref:Aspartyl/glutamyl-tRNA(Asn/Gln) amidotransferase subunit C n=1 Tax=Legionella quinlivanii TaxID=45073 RepID=A0A0W0Y3U8_9GAMM|nr:Asp-tRNA(Asn)/Glu-tRNA(Gln) amidotransferase subunit GatC [Legionella quinlivanii]KTD51692.1 glutamyl/tRNA (Gln) amidotransferase subunit C [Legionella quinlivanii]SEF63221.1 aspartyl/glutamyl-tRNA(Asn/Gln) amidotransferase subunit C [Legionella quinlivanii DSM 21216]STY10781.1 glutamyl/tRNA (Gln) amidotransferase subunit C [Legionella quinlivanii]
MTFSINDLHSIAQLAHLDIEDEDMDSLAKEVNSIINFAERIQQMNADEVAPLFHPMDMHQRFRPDEVSEDNCLQQLEEIAPLFEETYYLVPKVIDTEKQDV